MPISLHSGAWSAGVLGVLSAIPTVTSATPQSLGYYAGMTGLVVSLGILIWAIKWNDQHWWKRERIRVTWPYALMIVCGIGFAFGVYAAARGSATSSAMDTADSETTSAKGVLAPKPQSTTAAGSPETKVAPKDDKWHGLARLPVVAHAQDGSSVRDKYENNGINNGIMGPVTIGLPDRHIDDTLKARLLAIPKGTLLDIEVVMGDGEANRFGEEIAKFLAEHGYQISNFANSQGRPFPRATVDIGPMPGGTNISIGYR